MCQLKYKQVSGQRESFGSDVILCEDNCKDKGRPGWSLFSFAEIFRHTGLLLTRNGISATEVTLARRSAASSAKAAQAAAAGSARRHGEHR